MRSTRYNEEKAAAVLGLLLKKSGRARTKMELVKLAYLVEREMLKQYGLSVTGDALFAMRNGPILSATLDEMRGVLDGEAGNLFERAFIAGQVKHSLENAPDYEPNVAVLSDAEEQVIEAVFAEHGQKSAHELWLFTHRLKEYLDVENDAKFTSIPISCETVMLAMGCPQAAISRMNESAHEDDQISAFMKRLRGAASL